MTEESSNGFTPPVFNFTDEATPSTSRDGTRGASSTLGAYTTNATGTGEMEQQVFCGVCGKVSSRRDTLHGQANEHIGDKDHICRACDPSSVEKPKFGKHCRKRTVENNKCDMCDKMFHRADYLAVHYRTHTGERPYECEICGKSFRQPQHLHNHKRTHTEGRPAPAKGRILLGGSPEAGGGEQASSKAPGGPAAPAQRHPDLNKERRVARARALAETYADDAKAVYVDAAKHQRKPKTYVAAVVRATDGKVLNACSVRATSAEQAEEAAIALALSGIPEATTILSDSRTAIANFGRESVGTPAASLLPRTKSTTTHLRWFPAHVGVIPGGAANRNDEADVVARELAYRAAPPPPPPRPSEADEADFLDPDPLLDYGGILAWYREGRRALPGPHPRLGRREGVLLRQLQTGTVLTPVLARHVCPGLFESATCCVCARELATLAHVLSGCDACAGGTVRDSLPPDMEHYISSPDHQAQLQAIQRLDAALARQKRTEATPSS
ncbi:hypothetical protein HPB49_002339 [Dermacentor silvarum]|uniref:Uncharacterized protein n=1 Tax=Dermacentor silvarum TaxID=543639 RepID=A0ACB8DHV5_DERSI|nr:hypothetical protein HPB49_002339 [Dermacentor silvarum]